MQRIPLALTAVFFIASMGTGIMAARKEAQVWRRGFWLSMGLFLAASSLSLFAFAPVWVALAPVIPAVIIALLFFRSRTAALEDMPEPESGTDNDQ